MKHLLVGGSGVIGRALVPLLLARGDEVVGTSRTSAGVRVIEQLGAAGTVLDLYDAEAIARTLDRVQPNAVICQVTDLPDDVQQLADRRAGNAKIRREAIPVLIRAAAARTVTKILVQSIAWPAQGDTAEAVAALESATLGAGGTVLRYGQFYGPGTFHQDRPQGPAVAVRDAARATIAALDQAPGVLTITS